MGTFTLFSQGSIVSNGSSSTQDQVLGVQFSVSTSATFTAVWFYSPAAAAGLPGACALYAVSGQTQLVLNNSPSWSGAAGSGWVRAAMTAHSLVASTAYVVAAWNGASFSGLWDDYETGYWTTGGAGAGGITSGVLSAPNSAGGNTGILLNSAGSIAYPTSSLSNSNYWVDVEVTATVAGGSGPLMGAFP